MEIAAFFVVFLILFGLKPSRIDGTYLDWLTHGLLPVINAILSLFIPLLIVLYLLPG